MLLKQIYKQLFFALILIFLALPANSSGYLDFPPQKYMKVDYTKLAQDLLFAVKTEDSTEQLVQTLAFANPNDLLVDLNTDAKKLAFWLNLYNAFVQMKLLQNPELYKNRAGFYKKNDYTIAGRKLSLDDIEHGILRHSKIKISLGYLNKWFPNRFERKFRVKNLDNRIHFALNCGAKSCPPIRFYEPDKIDKQLDLASKVYLEGEVKYLPQKNKIYVPKLFSWFRGDFGGKKGIKKFLKKHQLLDENANPDLVFSSYNWDLDLKNFDN